MAQRPMTDATELDIDAIRARVEAATEGPWRAAEQTHGNWFGIQDEWYALGTAYRPADAEFIAHARTDVPLLLDEITRLRAALDEARDQAQSFSEQLLAERHDHERTRASKQALSERAANDLLAAEQRIADYERGMEVDPNRWVDDIVRAKRPDDNTSNALE